MASSRLSQPRDLSQWRHLLRATLRECTYLPDPIARTYMRRYVVDRYRRTNAATKSVATLMRTAKSGLSLLRRASEGYPKPFDRVMLMSYGRIGKQRHRLLAVMLEPEVPNDAEAVRKLLEQPAAMQDGWEPPEIMTRLIKSQVNNGVIMSSRLRSQMKTARPVIPEKNSWGKPICRSRRVNIRRRWYSNALDSLYPPLPESELRILEGLISGSVPWTPIQRRKKPQTAVPGDLDVMSFLEKGPQKGHTFHKYINGRPHKFTARFMLRTWKRISGFVPRMHWNSISNKWMFTWDTSEAAPRLSFDLEEGADLDHLFGEEAGTQSQQTEQTARVN